ncbi:hypothetical protein K493DRAFT_346988 [Basidiobolus meristosporus CBS 931.73]|uniref:Inhibitor I9 domain-containing protein n=1 Tax=Basidiobolus meristosporus CBS 931.73 TaxID=1314790 RepID=A0A1Y1YWI4_9FUNG|nr:hypothetical protein K493DRAFT_346988 [Basidiobolus meristosporus CBS 931.73]|eukprot:ORY01925.1 hypothetical protein K493DRAFT_346988 [Basidiobolus meristosporus CBS 931.73]
MSSTGDYIVMFHEGTPRSVIDEEVNKVQSQGGTIKHRYDSGIFGFAASIPDDHLTALNVSEHVKLIEPDGEVTTCAKNLGIGK